MTCSTATRKTRREADWLQEYLDAKWDKELDEDIAAGRVKSLDEVLNHG